MQDNADTIELIPPPKTPTDAQIEEFNYLLRNAVRLRNEIHSPYVRPNSRIELTAAIAKLNQFRANVFDPDQAAA